MQPSFFCPWNMNTPEWLWLESPLASLWQQSECWKWPRSEEQAYTTSVSLVFSVFLIPSSKQTCIGFLKDNWVSHCLPCSELTKALWSPLMAWKCTNHPLDPGQHSPLYVLSPTSQVPLSLWLRTLPQWAKFPSAPTSLHLHLSPNHNDPYLHWQRSQCVSPYL